VEIIEFTTYSEKSPFTGFGVWILLEKNDGKAHLLHPIHLCELTVREFEFCTSVGNSIWPVNSTGTNFSASKFIESFKNRIAFFLEIERAFPIQTVAKALAFFEDISVESALDYIKSSLNESDEYLKKDGSERKARAVNKSTREFRLSDDPGIKKLSPREKVILEALKENGPASIYSITSLVDKTLKTKSDKARVVTYFVNKMLSEGVLEIA